VISGSSHPTQRYPWPWLGGLILFGLGLLYVMLIRPQIPTFQSRQTIDPNFSNETGGQLGNLKTPDSNQDNTYLMIHFPPVYSSVVSAPEKAETWLAALASKGYQPELLSNVYRWLEEGKRLPGKTVVILFDPGDRATFNVMAPLLAKYKIPAVWVTDEKAQRRGDTWYVSNHVLKAMKKSGTWDIGHYDENLGLVIESKFQKPFTIGNTKGAWRAEAGRHALNRGVPEGSLNRLHVSWNWSGQNIIDRLQAEDTLQDTGILTLKKIQNHNWGVITPLDSEADLSFSLRAPTDSRTARLSWLGTRWRNNAQFSMEVKGLTGELWLLMRSDENAGTHVGVCFLNGKVSIAKQVNHTTRHLVDAMVPSLTQPSSFIATIVLKDTEMSVHINGALIAQTTNLPHSASDEGIVRMTVYDKIVGAAQVEFVNLRMTTLEHRPEIGVRP
jgi:hypothetical protein